MAMIAALSALGSFAMLWMPDYEGIVAVCALPKSNRSGWWLTFVVEALHSSPVAGIWTVDILYVVAVWCVNLFIFLTLTTSSRLGVLDFRLQRQSSASFRPHATSSLVESSSVYCSPWAADCCSGRSISVERT